MASVDSAINLEVLGKVHENGVALLTLNRPKALNAMNLDMDITFKSLIDSWKQNENVKAVIVEGINPRAFSSGGDVKWLATGGRKQYDDKELVQKVFLAEYSLICLIARYPKPYISFMDGITMGFGIGLSCHGAFRVITEKTLMAMPENKIGLFPDVGFAHIMNGSKEKFAFGLYMALTGARLSNPSDILFSGLATHFVTSEKLPALKKMVLELDLSSNAEKKVSHLLSEFSEADVPKSQFEHLLPTILEVFGSNLSVQSVQEKLKHLTDSPDEKISTWSKDSLSLMSSLSPFSLELTNRHFQKVQTKRDELAAIEGVMKQEYRMAVRMTLRSDFLEGVRAVLIDKDQKPEWKPKTMEEVDSKEVEEIFSALGHGFAELDV